MAVNVNRPPQKYREKTGAASLMSAASPPASALRRSCIWADGYTPFARAQHSPPACGNQRPSRTDQRRTSHRRPGPARDAKEEQHQPHGNEHTAHQLPYALIRGWAALWLIGLIPDFSHRPFPRFTPSLCPFCAENAGDFPAPCKGKLCIQNKSVTFDIYKRAEIV